MVLASVLRLSSPLSPENMIHTRFVQIIILQTQTNPKPLEKALNPKPLNPKP